MLLNVARVALKSGALGGATGGVAVGAAGGATGGAQGGATGPCAGGGTTRDATPRVSSSLIL